MEYDELELDTLGEQKTALFVIISDTDATFNFVVSIMYSQLFNLLCDKADDVYNGRLPVHVRCLLDEFSNIGQIPQFEKLIATIRSREISASIAMYLCENRKAPGTAYRQTECTGCQQGSPKDFPALILPQRAGIYIQSSFFIKKSNLRKERGKNHEFFYNSSNRIKDSRNSNRSRRGSMGRYQPSGRLWK